MAFGVGYLSGLDFDERVFVAGTWTGKASVQAALCGAALEMVHRRSWNGQVEETWAKTVFVCMVSGIIVGGPFASVWVGYFGEKAVGLAKYLELDQDKLSPTAPSPVMSHTAPRVSNESVKN